MVSGTGFAAYSTIAVLKIGGISALPLPAPATDALGTFRVTAMVPALPVGPTIVEVTAGSTGTYASYTVTAVSPTPTDALAGIAGKYTRVWGFNSATQTWKLFDPAVPAISDLTALVRGQGYWLKVTEASTLIYKGNSYTLSVGWNLIGWLD